MSYPSASKLEAFRIFLSRLISLQKDLDQGYRKDRSLRHMLTTIVYTRSIQIIIKVEIPCSAEQLNVLLANRFFEKPRIVLSPLVRNRNFPEILNDNQQVYKPTQSYKKNKDMWSHPKQTVKYAQRSTEDQPRYFRKKQLRPSLTHAMKAFFAGAEDHLSRRSQ